MAWQTPKTNWQNNDVVSAADMNRIEGNISELKKAANIDIQDAAGNFTATNVEDALAELASNVQTGKNAIANAITAMGQTASGDDTFATLASKIRDISKDADATPADVAAGKTFYADGIKQTGTMPPFEVNVIGYYAVSILRFEPSEVKYIDIPYPAGKTIVLVYFWSETNGILYANIAPTNPDWSLPVETTIYPSAFTWLRVTLETVQSDYVRIKVQNTNSADTEYLTAKIYIVGY